MRKLQLLSGRVKKITGSDLDANRYDFLDLSNAEPDAGYPSADNSLLSSTAAGARSWLTTNTSTSGLSVSNGNLTVDEDSVFVDTTGFVNTSASDLHTVLFDLDQNLGSTTANALTAVVTDNTIDGNGTTNSALTIGQGVRPTDSPYFAGLSVDQQDAISGISLTNPLRVTVSTAHDLNTGDIVTFRDIVGTTQLNGNDYYVEVVDTTNVDLYSDAARTTAIDGTSGYTAYTSGGFMIGGGYRFPTLDGVDGQFLRTNGVGTLNFNSPISYGATQPSSPYTGDLWYNTNTGQEDLLIYDGTNWVSATEGGAQGAFTLRQFAGDGTTTQFNTNSPATQKVLVFLNGILLRLTDDFTWSSGVVTFLQAPLNGDTIEVLLTGDADLVGLDLLGIANHDLITVDTSGNVTLQGELDMATNKIVNLGTPTANTDAATKAYVDSTVGAVTINTSGDTGSGSVESSTQILNIAGTANEIETAASNQSVTIGLPDDVSITNNLTVGGYLAGPATFTIDPAGVGDNTGTVVIAGNLQIDGTTTTINSTTLTVDDLNIVVASGAANAAATDGAGLTVDVANATILYDQPNDYWVFNKAPYYNSLRLLTTSDLTGSDNYAYKTIEVTDTDATFSWSETGSIVAPSNTGTLKFVSGGAIDIDVDLTGYAIRVEHTDTSTIADITAANNTNQFLAALAMTFDTYGHVQSVTPTYSNVVFNNDFGTLSVVDTDSGYTWAETGNVGAGQTSDTATYVSGDGINIDVDSTNKAIRWTNTDKGSDQNTISTVVVQNTTTGFSFSETGTFNASNADTITLIPQTGFDIDIDTTNGGLTFTNTDTGSAQNIIKSVTVVDSSTGFTFSETGTFTTAVNADSFTFVQGTGIDLDIDTTNGAIRITGDDLGSSQNIFKTLTVSDTNSGYTWTETGSVAASTNSDTATFVSGTGIDLDVDSTNKAILVQNTDTGSSQNIVKAFAVTDTNTGYTWTESGTINAASNSDTITFVSGTSLDVDVDTTNKAILIQHNVSGANSTISSVENTFLDRITVDAQGHVTTVGSAAVNFNVSENYAFKTVVAAGTNLVAESNTDTLTINTGQVDSTNGISIVGNATTDTITISHADTSSVTNVTSLANNFVTAQTYDTYGHVLTTSKASVDFTVAANHAFKTISVSGQNDVVADSNIDTLNLSAGGALSITTNQSTDTITFSVTDTGSAQNIIKNVYVTDTNTGYTWGETGNWSASSNNDSITFVSGAGIDLDIDTASKAILVRNTDVGSAQNVIKSIEVSDTDSGYTWANTGTITTTTNSDLVKFISGSGIDIDVDTSSKAIRIENTSINNDPGSSQDIIKNIIVTDTDTGYTWSETGTYSVSGNNDSLTFVSGTGIDIDVDTTTGAVRIENPAAGNAFTEQTYTGDGTTTQFAVGTGFTSVNVYVNGVLVDDGTDYTFTQNTGDLDFTVPPANQDLITVHKFTNVVSSITLTSLGISNHDEVAVDGSGNVTITGNLTVQGTTTQSSTQTLADPVLNLGGTTAPTADDNLDRGVKFRWHDGTNAKQGFFGFDDTDYDFMFIPDSNGTNAFGPAGGGTDLADYGGAKFKHVIGQNVRMGYTGANEIDTSSGNLTIDSAGGTVTVDDNLNVTGALDVTGNAIVDGNVGIGSGSPQDKLDVNGTVRSKAPTANDWAFIGYNSAGTASSGLWYTSNRARFLGRNAANTLTVNIDAGGDSYLNGGNVGINTSAPAAKLHIRGPDNATTGPIINLSGDSVNQTESGRIRFTEGAMGSSPFFQGAYVHYDGSANYFKIGTHDTADTTISNDVDAIYIPRGAARVGIGKTPAGGKELDVNGDGAFSGSLAVTSTLSAGNTTVSSLQVNDLTDNRIVVAGASGELEDSASLTFDGTTFEVGTNFDVTSANGNTAIGGTLSAGNTTVSSLQVSDLTDNRIVVASTSGELADDANFRFDGTDFDIGASGSETFSVAVATGNITSSGDVTATGGTFGNVKVGVTGDNEIDTSSGNLTIDSAGGTTTIDDILSVSGAATFSSTVGITSDLTVDTSTLKVDATNNRVGVGTATPTVTMDVRGDVLSYQNGFYVEMSSNGASDRAGIEYVGTGHLGVLSDSLVTFRESDANTVRSTFNLNNNTFRFGDTTDPGANETMQIVGATTISDDLKVDTDTLFVDASADRVGVNTATPSTALEVVGTATVDQLHVGDHSSGFIESKGTGGNRAWAFGDNDGDLHWLIGANDVAGIGDNPGNPFQIKVRAGNGAASNFTDNWASEGTIVMSMNDNGTIGIGTDAPARKLHVIGSGGTIATKIEATDGNQASVDLKNSEGEFRLITDAGELKIYDQGDTAYRFVMDTTGDIGVGTETVNAKLHLYTGGLGADTGTTDMLRLEVNRSDHGATPSGPAILFKDQDTNNSTNEARIKMLTVNDTDFGDNDEAASNLVFETTNSGTASDKMIITGRGSVGIGTNNPAVLATLDVNGQIKHEGIRHEYMTATTSSTTPTNVALISTLYNRSCKATIQVTRGSEYQVTEALIIHDGTDQFITTYGTVFTGSAALASFDAPAISGIGNFLALEITPTSATTTTYKIYVRGIEL